LAYPDYQNQFIFEHGWRGFPGFVVVLIKLFVKVSRVISYALRGLNKAEQKYVGHN